MVGNRRAYWAWSEGFCATVCATRLTFLRPTGYVFRMARGALVIGRGRRRNKLGRMKVSDAGSLASVREQTPDDLAGVTPRGYPSCFSSENPNL